MGIIMSSLVINPLMDAVLHAFLGGFKLGAFHICGLLLNLQNFALDDQIDYLSKDMLRFSKYFL